jgi:hypothetical protein
MNINCKGVSRKSGLYKALFAPMGLFQSFFYQLTFLQATWQPAIVGLSSPGFFHNLPNQPIHGVDSNILLQKTL